MKIAYLINQYPKVSHSFIRREIAALEGLGVTIARYSIRAVPLAQLADQEDKAEHGKTFALLSAGLPRLVGAALGISLASPRRFFAAMSRATSLGRRSRRGVLRHWVYLAEACLLKQALAAGGISHVHAHFGTNSAAVAMLCFLVGGPGYSFTVHGPEEFDDPVGLSLAEKIVHCRFVVAVSHFGGGQLMRHCPPRQWRKIQLVRCAVDETFLQAEEVPVPVVPRLVCVGRLCAQKGQLLLLEALRELDQAGIAFSLVLAGDGEMRGEVEELIGAYGLQDKVTVSGWISGERVKEYLLSARAMVLPSFAEGLPVVIMEALALRRPVLTTFVAGIPELVVNGENGWLVPAGSVADLVVALKEVLAASPEFLQRLGRAGAVRVAQRHNAVIEARTLAALFAA